MLICGAACQSSPREPSRACRAQRVERGDGAASCLPAVSGAGSVAECGGGPQPHQQLLKIWGGRRRPLLAVACIHQLLLPPCVSPPPIARQQLPPARTIHHHGHDCQPLCQLWGTYPGSCAFPSRCASSPMTALFSSR